MQLPSSDGLDMKLPLYDSLEKFEPIECEDIGLSSSEVVDGDMDQLGRVNTMSPACMATSGSGVFGRKDR